jgi:hypothetical protein
MKKVKVTEPKTKELSGLISQLVQEVGDTLQSDSWVLLNRPSAQIRIHEGAALWHCCSLLADLDVAAKSGREVVLRLVARAHLEAWITALFLHYGEMDALEQVAGDLRYNLQTQQDHAMQYDKRLAAEHKRVRKLNERIQADNEQKTKWNSSHADQPQRELGTEVAMSNRPPIALDLSGPIAGLSGVKAQRLPFSTIIAQLNKLAKEKAIGEENFDVLYIVIYRLLSTVGAHPSLELFNTYIQFAETDNFVRVRRKMNSPSFDPVVRHTSLMATAFLTNRVLAKAGGSSPVADAILDRYPDSQVAVTHS